VKVAVESRPPVKGDAVTVRFVTREDRAALGVAEEEFSARANALLHLRHESTLLVGLGERAKADAHRMRNAAGAAALFLKKIGRTRVALNLEDWPQFAGAAIEGIVLANYRFDLFKETKAISVESVHLQVPEENLKLARRAVERGRVIAAATNACREIGNLPGNVLYPETLAQRVRQVGSKRRLKCTVLDEKALRAGKFGGMLAVGAGSVRAPRLMALEHRGGPKGQAPLVLVGKAITFDSGGISIKPAANMEEMIFDKCGGMAVIGAMAAIAELKLKRNVVGIIASAENLPGPTAYRPGDIITAYDGRHIEIINTDAEGRVVLADAIAWARKDFRAAAIIDLATLTGACGIALGEYAAGFWTNDDGFGKAVLAASERAGERLWPMPMFSEYEDQIKSDVALIKNSGGRLGGACTGAAFLKVFAEGTPWAHLDIAYTSHREKDQAHMARGATGFGVRTLVELAETWEPAVKG
jgi:leucyl aminopeptidase